MNLTQGKRSRLNAKKITTEGQNRQKQKFGERKILHRVKLVVPNTMEGGGKE